MNTKKRITILGSTGSIGTQALEVLEKIQTEYKIVGLSCGNNIDLFLEQIKKFNPSVVYVKNEKDADKIRSINNNVNIYSGIEGISDLIKENEQDIVLVALSGKIGLKPTITALEKGTDVALANKETLVMAGELVKNIAKKSGAKLIPVDSEHSAIFQCLQCNKTPHKLIITASGGPFLNTPKEEMDKATSNLALNHPRWKMGKKVTVDSATLMNKALEVIEPHHLFDMDYKDIKVVIHPESVLHSAVEFSDGSILGQFGVPSMHIPIQYALFYPNRIEGIKTESFDFTEIASMHFSKPDFDKFPLLKLAINCGIKGKSYPICLNAADEICVNNYLEGKISFAQIVEIVTEIIDTHIEKDISSLNDIFDLDSEIRIKTQNIIDNINRKGN